MQWISNAREMRELDRSAIGERGIPSTRLMEAAARADVIVFDKTGTLTQNRMVVMEYALPDSVRPLEEAGLEGAPAVVSAVRHEIEAAGGRVDYVELLDVETLENPTAETKEALFALAAYFGSTRLIDNELIQVKK